MSFKTSPRYVGEFANRQYKASKELENEYGYSENVDYAIARRNAQDEIEKTVRMYNRGLITDIEALKILLKTI